MLENINNVLNSGNIPNIYKEEDYEEIKKAVQQEWKVNICKIIEKILGQYI